MLQIVFLLYCFNEANFFFYSFALDRNTGLIKVQKALESGKEYKLIVRASDQGNVRIQSNVFN